MLTMWSLCKSILKLSSLVPASNWCNLYDPLIQQFWVTTIYVVSTSTDIFEVDVRKLGKKKLEHSCKSACCYMSFHIVHIPENILKAWIIHFASNLDVKYFSLLHFIFSLCYILIDLLPIFKNIRGRALRRGHKIGVFSLLYLEWILIC